MKWIYMCFICLLMVGCKESTQASKSRYLNISFRTDPRSFEPRLGVDYPSAHAVKMLFEGLMRKGLDGEVKPAIAESFTLSENQKHYTFHLRKTYWSNGEPVTAQDFEAAWKAVVDPYAKSLGSQHFYCLKNAQAIVTGKLPIEALGVKAIDDQTLEVELENPTPYFLELLTSVSFFPIPHKLAQAHPDWSTRTGKDFVCNGPFLLQSYRHSHEIVVEKNPRYWDARVVKLPGIRIAIVPDSTTHLSLFEKKELDWAGKPLGRLTTEAIESYKAQHKITISPHLSLYWLFLNTEQFPFQNQKMRLAFSYAIDREEITNHLLCENETPARGILPAEIALQRAPYFEDHQIEKARALFDEALQELGMSRETFPELVLHVGNEPISLRVMQTLQAQWKAVLGVQVSIRPQEWKVHYDQVQTGQYQIGAMVWVSFLKDPAGLLQVFRFRSDGLNMSRWENSRYQEQLLYAEREANPEKRREALHEAERILMQEMPVIPLYFCTISYMKNERLKDVYLASNHDMDFRWAYFE